MLRALPAVAKRGASRALAERYFSALRSIGAAAELRPDGCCPAAARTPPARAAPALPASASVAHVDESMRVQRETERAIKRFRAAEGLDEPETGPASTSWNPAIPKAPSLPHDLAACRTRQHRAGAIRRVGANRPAAMARRSPRCASTSTPSPHRRRVEPPPVSGRQLRTKRRRERVRDTRRGSAGDGATRRRPRLDEAAQRRTRARSARLGSPRPERHRFHASPRSAACACGRLWRVLLLSLLAAGLYALWRSGWFDHHVRPQDLKSTGALHFGGDLPWRARAKASKNRLLLVLGSANHTCKGTDLLWKQT